MGDPTTINGENRAIFPLRKVDKITIKTGNAPMGDSVLVRDIELDHKLQIFSGNGSDNVEVRRVVVENDLVIRTSGKPDVVDVVDTNIEGRFTVRGGDLEDRVTANRVLGLGRAKLLGDDGSDIVQVDRSTFLQQTDLSARGAADTGHIFEIVSSNLCFADLHLAEFDHFRDAQFGSERPPQVQQLSADRGEHRRLGIHQSRWPSFHSNRPGKHGRHCRLRVLHIQ